MLQALRLFLLLTAGLLLAGCAIHTKEQIAAVRSAGVAPETVRKISGRGILSPEDIVELRKRRVDDALVIRHIEEIGVNYVVQKDEIKAMRSAGVRPTVISTLVRASSRFVAYLYAPSTYQYSFGYWGDPFYSPYYSGYYGGAWSSPYYPRYYGGAGAYYPRSYERAFSPYRGVAGPYGGAGVRAGTRRWH